MRKLKNDYAGDASRLKDLVRFTASFPNCSRMKQFVERLRAQPGIKVLALRNKYASPTPLGYRDVNLTLQVQLASGRPHVCELQVNLDDMLVAKELAHALYEKVSLLWILSHFICSYSLSFPYLSFPPLFLLSRPFFIVLLLFARLLFIPPQPSFLSYRACPKRFSLWGVLHIDIHYLNYWSLPKYKEKFQYDV